tara:strand:+ start:979 stop:2148 length:1170 start_codon:yes stop_codon:yes gene_type:complete
MFNNLLNRILYRIIRRLVTIFIFQKSNRIVFVQESNSGSNSFALYKLADKKRRLRYDLILLKGLPQNYSFVDFIKWYKVIASSKIIFTTHQSLKPSKKHIHFQLWHGNMTKKLGVMEHGNNENFKYYKSWLDVDHIMSYSETYTTFLNACMVTDPKKYVITGAPRNDLLLNSNGKKNLELIFGEEIKNSKIIWFTPTFRDYFGRSQGNKSFLNPFGFKEFDIVSFDTFLEKQGTKMILKPHPQEEELIIQYFKDYPISNMLMLRSQDLENHQIDFYEVLNAGDMLITDYSSIFYDFLLLNRPTFFIPIDIEEYKIDRGFLMESYLDFVPGSTIFNQEKLVNEISKILVENKDVYVEKRKWMLKFCHRYIDSDSSNRIYKFIDKMGYNSN